MTTRTPTIILCTKRWNLTAFLATKIDGNNDRKLIQFSVFSHILIELVVISFIMSQTLLVLWVSLTRKVFCPECKSRLYIKRGRFGREQGLRKFHITLKWDVQRFKCKNCGKSFNRFTNTSLSNCKVHPLVNSLNLIFSLVDFGIFSNVPSSNCISLIKSRLPNQQKYPSDTFVTLSRYFMTCLNEKQRRLYSGLLVLLYESISKVHFVTSKARKTIKRGLTELQNRFPTNSITEPIRLSGAGRPRLDANPQYYEILDVLLEEETSGDPMKVIKYRYTSLRLLSKILKNEFDLLASPNSVRQMLMDMDYSLKSNNASISKKLVDDELREQQFQIIFAKKELFLSKQLPVISVDAKKKEQIANFKMPGQTWRKDYIETLDHDFPDQAEGSLVPFGVYNLLTNSVFVNCGTNHNTSEFAVESIAEWWNLISGVVHEGTSEILVYADCGPSSGPRTNLWKWFLQTKVADRFGLTVHVCNFPPGTSKWNFIEHRVFSFITKNWRGEPLTNYEKAINYIRTTTTEKGLTVEARLDAREYKTGLQVDAIEMASYY